MEIISLKLDKTTLNNLDSCLKSNNFSTRTEFVREAIRDKINELEHNKLLKEFLRHKGKLTAKTTNQELKEIRENVFKELEKQIK
jgi:metal-responsive CopG/Arc/MetJ family transcriptional regulator